MRHSSAPHSLRDFGIRRCLAWVGCVLFVGILGCAQDATAQDVALHLAGDASGTLLLTKLAIGDSLFVSATGLPAERSVRIVLVDKNGALVRSEATKSDHQGNVKSVLLWARTGVRGCDAGTYVGYSYERFADAAVALTGTSVTVALWDTASNVVLATASLPVVAQDNARVFVGDVSLCPIQMAASQDTMFLVADGEMEAAVRVFVVPHQEDWTPGMMLADVRSDHPRGQLIAKAETGWVDVLAPAGSLPPGRYDVIVRPLGGTTRRFEVNDIVLVFPPPDYLEPVTSNAGMAIDPWGANGGEPL